MHCLGEAMKNNQYYEDTKLSKTRDFKLYKSCEAIEEVFSTGKMLSGDIVKVPDGDENLYVCYDKKEKSRFVFKMVKFNDDRGCSRFNLYYTPILFSKRKTVFFFILQGWG